MHVTVLRAGQQPPAPFHSISGQPVPRHSGGPDIDDSSSESSGSHSLPATTALHKAAASSQDLFCQVEVPFQAGTVTTVLMAQRQRHKLKPQTQQHALPASEIAKISSAGGK